VSKETYYITFIWYPRIFTFRTISIHFFLYTFYTLYKHIILISFFIIARLGRSPSFYLLALSRYSLVFNFTTRETILLHEIPISLHEIPLVLHEIPLYYTR
jgi:hypothetical protein